MNTQTTDKATPRPWKATRDQKQHTYGWYYWQITHTEPRSNQPPQYNQWERIIATLETDDEMTQANAELIVRAVNEYDALQSALDNLAAVRKGGVK